MCVAHANASTNTMSVDGNEVPPKEDADLAHIDDDTKFDGDGDGDARARQNHSPLDSDTSRPVLARTRSPHGFWALGCWRYPHGSPRSASD